MQDSCCVSQDKLPNYQMQLSEKNFSFSEIFYGATSHTWPIIEKRQ